MKRQNQSTKIKQYDRQNTAGFSRRTLIIISGIVALLIVGGIITYLNLKPTSPLATTNDTQNIQESPFSPSVSKLVANTVMDANEAIEGDDLEAGVAVYQKAIDETDDSKEKSALLVKQAEFLSARSSNESAIPVVLKAQEVNGETLETTSMLALLYELTGDNPNAAIYYRKAADHLLLESGDKTNVYDPEQEAAYYREKANELEAQQ